MWQEYQKKMESFQGTATVLRQYDNKLVLHSRVSFKRNPSCRLFLSQSLLTAEQAEDARMRRGDLWSFNPKYAFRLERTEENTGWLVKTIALQQEGDANPLAVQASQAVGDDRFCCSLIKVYGEDLLDFVRRPGFVVLKAAPVTWKGVPLVEIQFDNPHPLKEPGKRFCPVQSGTLVLDPNRYWCLRSSKLQCKYDGAEAQLEDEFELVDPTAAFPVPKSYYGMRKINGAPTDPLLETSETNYEFKESSGQPDDWEFSLSAFGFPEPVGIVWERPTRWYLWIGVTAFSALALGVLCRVLRRRYQDPKLVKQ